MDFLLRLEFMCDFCLLNFVVEAVLAPSFAFLFVPIMVVFAFNSKIMQHFYLCVFPLSECFSSLFSVCLQFVIAICTFCMV